MYREKSLPIFLWMKNWLWQDNKELFKKNKLEIFDVSAMSELLINGLTLSELLDLLETKDNEVVFNLMRNRMKQGNGMEDIFNEVCPKQIHRYLKTYLQLMSLSEALKHSMRLFHNQEELKNKIIKLLRYPLLLLMGTLVGFLLFTRLCMPMMMNIFHTFQSNSDLIILEKSIEVCGVVLFIMCLAVLLVVVYFSRESHQVQGYIALNRVNRKNIWTLSVSCSFAMYFNETLKAGCGTKETINLLKHTQEELIVFLGECIEDVLLKGKRLNDAFNHPYLDAQLARFMVVGMQSGHLEMFLDNYVNMTQELIENRAKKVTRVIQLFSYALIGVVLIFVYQILLMPLNMLAQM